MMKINILLNFFSLLLLARVASFTLPLAMSEQYTADRILSKLPWKPDGYDTWKFRNEDGNFYSVSYTSAGDKDKPALLLCHGFGASLYHWRYNIPELSEHYNVYAIDLLGFGQSDKPLIDYSVDLWSNQVASFVRSVIGKPTVIAGNSLGGYTALAAASQNPDIITGCVLLNSAGRFKDSLVSDINETSQNLLEEPSLVDRFVASIKAAFQRGIIGLSFYYTKQPTRIRQVLMQVYSVNPENVDDELVESIQQPSMDPNASEVFYRVIAKNGGGPALTIDALLKSLCSPLLLLWGEKDPWIRPLTADKIQSLYPKADRVNINAGHCPHDEAPVEVNRELRAWLNRIGHV